MSSFREWLSDNLRYILLGMAVILVLVIVVFVVKLTGGSGRQSEEESRNVVVETSSETETQTESEQSLVENDAAVLETVQKYFTAMSGKDMETLESMVEAFDDTDRQTIQSSIIQSYNNVVVYSKNGPEADSYVVYAYYEAKVGDIEELVPSLTCLYLETDESGNLYVADWESDEATAAYIEDMKNDADVQALIQKVDDAYREVEENNEELRNMINKLDEPETEITIPEVSDKDAQANQVVQATDVLNVRADSREDAELLGVLAVGEQVTRVKILDNGWAEIKYGQETGYVLNEYLEDVSQ